MIIVKDLNKSFGKIRALKDLNLHVKKNKIHGIIGPESSGKTTVLRILSTLVMPDSGSVTIDNIELNNFLEIRKLIGFVPDKPQLPYGFTAYDLVTISANLRGIYDKEKINKSLKQTGIETIANQSIERYSDSIKKALAISMAIVHDPEVLLLDEPMEGLDIVSQRRFKNYLLSSNKTIIMTGTELDKVEGICESVTIISRGSVVIEDTYSAIRQKVGKGTLEIKLADDTQTNKLLFELDKKWRYKAVSKNSVYVSYNNDYEIPEIIKIASNTTDIMEVKPIKVSIGDIFIKFNNDEALK